MHHVRHSCRSVAIKVLKLVLMRSRDHQVRTDMELSSSRMKLADGTAIHICDSYSINVRRPPGNAVFHPLKIYADEASWFVVWIPGNARKIGPFVRAFAENTVFAIGRRRPVEQRRIFRDRRGTGAQSVRNFSASVTGGVPALCIESQPAIKHTIAINLIS